MGIEFIGNPFDQENDYDDSDWEMNADEEWVTPPEEIALVDVLERTHFNLFLAAGTASSGEESDPNWQESNDDDTDEDYNPDDEDYEVEDEVEDFVSEQNDHYFYDDTDDEEEIDYVTFPLSDETPTELDKPAADDATNTRENNDCI